MDHLVLRSGLGRPQLKFRGEFWRMQDCILLKPLTFMNLSGAAVREAFDFYKLTPADVLVIYDDWPFPSSSACGSARGILFLKLRN